MGYYCSQKFTLFFSICPSKWHVQGPTNSYISLPPRNVCFNTFLVTRKQVAYFDISCVLNNPGMFLSLLKKEVNRKGTCKLLLHIR